MSEFKRKKKAIQNRKRRKRKKQALYLSVLLMVVLVSIVGGYKYIEHKKEQDEIRIQQELEEKRRAEEEAERNKIVKRDIVITAAGDCTLGTDTNFAYGTGFLGEADRVGNDYSHFMKNVKDIFENDDYTIVNLETTFTEAAQKVNKGQGVAYHFKGPKEFVNILTSSSIEGVTISNNHIYDYGQQGFEDTVATLEEENVEFCGEGYKILTEIQGVKFGFLGYQAWSDTEDLKNKIAKDIKELKENGAAVVIPYFHWGIERAYEPYNVQINIARFAIDSGADMVLGSHPHVMQSLESYKGKMIVYSLGNFSFGGNSNPSDKRTFIIQAKFSMENENVVNTQFKVIPTMISSVSNKNDYVPTPATGDNKINILSKLNELSPTLNNKLSDEYFSITE